MAEKPQSRRNLALAAVLAAIVALAPAPAYAYIGPAFAFLAYLAGPVVAFFAVLGMILYYPVKALVRKRRQRKRRNQPARPRQTEKPAG